MIETVQFHAVLITALNMSVHFGTWVTERPIRETTSGELFIEVHKGRDADAARLMPILGNASILLVAIGTFLVRTELIPLAVAAAGLVLIIADVAVTLRGNVPINKHVQSWQQDAPPPDWTDYRDRWERLHTLRTWLVVPGFALYTASVIFF